MASRNQGPRIYRYVHVADDGMAPCSDHGLVTLATCKPKIRSAAREGDWVVGFYPAPWEPGIISWAARISRKLDHFTYQAAHGRRRDAVYRPGPQGEPIRLQPDYHSDRREMEKDLSAPVLIFDPKKSWYFGDKPACLPGPLMHLAAKGQGHRVNFRQPGDYEAFCDWLDQCGPPGILGNPREASGCGKCGKPAAPKCVKVC